MGSMTLEIPLGGVGLGRVVIDSTVGDTSSGGVRIGRDVTLAEVAALAAEMTKKYSFFGLRKGGAKTGICLPPELPATEKLSLLREFGRSLGPVIRKGIYYPGMDMNCGEEEIRQIYGGAGMELGKVTDTSYFTAISVANAVEACEGRVGAGRPVRLAIQGFGSVAAYLVARLPRDRFRVVGVSTVAGGVVCKEGLDPDELLRARKRLGDRFVEEMEAGERIGTDRLFETETDVFLPAARTWALDGVRAAALETRAVVPIANVPYTAEGLDVLTRRGILCLPGFVANGGGVFASSLFDSAVPLQRIEAIARGPYRQAVDALLDRAAAKGVSAVRVAEEVALERARAAQAAPAGSGDLWKRLRRKGLVPGVLYGKRVGDAFEDGLAELKRSISSW